LSADPERKLSKSTKIDRRRTEFSGRCSVCMSDRRGEAELAYAKGVGRRQVGARYNLSPDAVQRHWAHHVSDQTKALRKLDALKPGANLKSLVDEEDHGILDNLRIVRAGLLRRYDTAVQIGSDAAVAQLSSQLHKNIELAGRHTGDLRALGDGDGAVQRQLQEFIQMRMLLIKTLRPFPEPLAAVVEMLRGLEPSRTSGQPALIEGRAVEVAHA
jgi:hypothetical protein